jgi:hypothetical protein
MFMNIFLLKSRSNKRHLILFTTFLNGSNWIGGNQEHNCSWPFCFWRVKNIETSNY